MSGYFDRGASAGGHDQGYFDREDVTGPSGVGSATGGPGGVADVNGRTAEQDSVSPEDIVLDEQNPNIARAVPVKDGVKLDETAGTGSPIRTDEPYQQIIEGSDSERTGTSWGLPGIEEDDSQARPNRNTGDVLSRDDLRDVGAWGTMDDSGAGSPGSPTGNS